MPTQICPPTNSPECCSLGRELNLHKLSLVQIHNLHVTTIHKHIYSLSCTIKTHIHFHNKHLGSAQPLCVITSTLKTKQGCWNYKLTASLATLVDKKMLATSSNRTKDMTETMSYHRHQTNFFYSSKTQAFVQKISTKKNAIMDKNYSIKECNCAEKSNNYHHFCTAQSQHCTNESKTNRKTLHDLCANP